LEEPLAVGYGVPGGNPGKNPGSLGCLKRRPVYVSGDLSQFPPPHACIDINACIAYNACIMSQLTIRGIDDGLKRALRMRAAENGRSMEEEVRQILRTAFDMPSPEEEHLKQLYGLEARNRG